jgi:hypothetical protein
MNNLSDGDPKLTNFLRQYRSISPIGHTANSPPNSIELEDRIMAEIDLLPIERQRRVTSRWWRSIFAGIGIIATGILGMTIHSIMNPPAPNMAELDRLDRYLADHWHGVDSDSKASDSPDNLDIDLFQEDDAEDIDNSG